MLQMGNSEGQVVRDCRLYEPRGWSALHFREGDDMQCRKAHVFGNEIVSSSSVIHSNCSHLRGHAEKKETTITMAPLTKLCLGGSRGQMGSV